MTNAEKIEMLEQERTELIEETERLENEIERLAVKLTQTELEVGAYSEGNIGDLIAAASEFLLWNTPEERSRYAESLGSELNRGCRYQLQQAITAIEALRV